MENIGCTLQNLNFYLVVSCTSIISQWSYCAFYFFRDEWLFFSTWVFLLKCFLKCAAIVSTFSFSLMVNSPASVLIKSGIFCFFKLNFFYFPKHPWRIILTVFNFLQTFFHFLFVWLFHLSIIFMISLRSFRRLFFVVLSVTFSIFSLISCCHLDSRAISSFTWKRCFGFFPRSVSAVAYCLGDIFPLVITDVWQATQLHIYLVLALIRNDSVV